MTASPEQERDALPARRESLLPLWKRVAVFGTGLGVAVGERNLEAVIVRSRPSGPKVLASAVIRDFRTRQAADWGGELRSFLTDSGESRLAATLLLPRDEVIVRALSLPGVADKDVANAIELQADMLHPYGDEEVAWGWSRAGRDTVVVAFTREVLLRHYETLFGEAGLSLAAATFSPAVIYSALRIWHQAPEALITFHTDDRGRTQIYRESPARPFYSAEFPVLRERALALSRAELRLTADFPAHDLLEFIPAPANGDAVPEAALAYAAAMAGSTARSARFANLIPSARRASHNRLQYVLPAVLGLILVAGLLAVFVVMPALEQRRYRADLDSASRRLEPAALRVRNLEARVAADRARVALLDDFRKRPQDDLEVLNELTRILPPQVWTNAIEIYPDSVVLSGEADQAASLLKMLDASLLFQNSEFALAVTRMGQGEQFRIKTMRRMRAGRTTP